MKTLHRIAATIALPFLATALSAQSDPAPTGASKPAALAIAETIPAPRDIPYPGTIQLSVDISDVARRIFDVTETIPVAGPGPLVLLHPAWLPGAHAPEGEIDKVAGLVITANGQTLPWKRDPTDVRAFRVEVPAGVTSVQARFQFLSATDENQGPVVVTPNVLALEWISTMLYPAGHYTRQIMVQPSATFPAGWSSATALRPSGPSTAAGGTVRYAPVALDTLADSPVFAGRYYRADALSPDVTLNTFAERPDQLAITPDQLAKHQALVAQATRLFGAQHYDHYDFLYVLSDRIEGFGLEHHRSSQNQAPGDYFLKWDNLVERDLLPHEFTHSWNGKFRRPADLWTPDYRTKMQNSLLWVYEGQTQFWGSVLAARSGLLDKKDALDSLALVAAAYDTQPGRKWRSLVDTTNEEIISERRPQPWDSWQRVEDYYREGQLIWTEVDALLRAKSGGRKSMDDFARAFFGVKDRDWGELTYTVEDVARTLNDIVPNDWMGFLKARVYDVAPKAPLAGITQGGYKLVYTDQPGDFWKSRESARKQMNLTYSLGLVIGKEGRVAGVTWDSPAFNAGITAGTTLVAIDGEAYSDDDLKAAITVAKGGSKPIQLLIRQGEAYRTVAVTWNGGLRYPHLERSGKGPASLDALYAARK